MLVFPLSTKCIILYFCSVFIKSLWPGRPVFRSTVYTVCYAAEFIIDYYWNHYCSNRVTRRRWQWGTTTKTRTLTWKATPRRLCTISYMGVATADGPANSNTTGWDNSRWSCTAACSTEVIIIIILYTKVIIDRRRIFWGRINNKIFRQFFLERALSTIYDFVPMCTA